MINIIGNFRLRYLMNDYLPSCFIKQLFENVILLSLLRENWISHQFPEIHAKRYDWIIILNHV